MTVPGVHDAPVVVTAALPDEEAERLDELRRAHFPSARNVVPAHVSLFHALPGAAGTRVVDVLGEVAAPQPPLLGRVSRLRSLGGGVALVLECPPLIAWHRRAQRALKDALAPDGLTLTRQDAAPLAPHVTVANRISPQAARDLLTDLQATFVPWRVHVLGVDLWRYLGGPWHPLTRVPFTGAAEVSAAAADGDA